MSAAPTRHQAWFLELRHDGERLRVHVASAGEPNLPDRSTCFEAALAGVELLDADGLPVPALGKGTPTLVVGVLVNPVDATTLPTVGPVGPRDVVFMTPEGRCFEHVLPPCAPRKSCIAPYDVAVSCPSDVGIPAPDSTPASELTLVADVFAPDGPPRRWVATRWDELCSIEERAPKETAVGAGPTTSTTFETTRAGPVPCRAMDKLASLARQVNDASRRPSKGRAAASPEAPLADTGEPVRSGESPSSELRLHRYEPSWSSIRVLVDLERIPDPPPEPWIELLTEIDALAAQWTLPVADCRRRADCANRAL